MKLEPDDLQSLRPLIHEAIQTILQHPLSQTERLGYPEREAAAMLGVASHVLRDCRLRGEIKARRVGKRYVYARSSLLRFLEPTGHD